MRPETPPEEYVRRTPSPFKAFLLYLAAMVAACLLVGALYGCAPVPELVPAKQLRMPPAHNGYGKFWAFVEKNHE